MAKDLNSAFQAFQQRLSLEQALVRFDHSLDPQQLALLASEAEAAERAHEDRMMRARYAIRQHLVTVPDQAPLNQNRIFINTWHESSPDTVEGTSKPLFFSPYKYSGQARPQTMTSSAQQSPLHHQFKMPSARKEAKISNAALTQITESIEASSIFPPHEAQAMSSKKLEVPFSLEQELLELNKLETTAKLETELCSVQSSPASFFAFSNKAQDLDSSSAASIASAQSVFAPIQ